MDRSLSSVGLTREKDNGNIVDEHIYSALMPRIRVGCSLPRPPLTPYVFTRSHIVRDFSMKTTSNVGPKLTDDPNINPNRGKK